MASAARIPLLIVGLGNVLLRDDGVGVHAVRALHGDPPPGSEVLEIGTAVLDAVSFLERADRVIALDAVRGGEGPGTIYRMELDDPEATTVPASLHELDLRGVLQLTRSAARPRVVVLGVEPAIIDTGLELSDVVQAMLPEYLRQIRIEAVQTHSEPPAE